MLRQGGLHQVMEDIFRGDERAVEDGVRGGTVFTLQVAPEAAKMIRRWRSARPADFETSLGREDVTPRASPTGSCHGESYPISV